jgi:hypothetical protein
MKNNKDKSLENRAKELLIEKIINLKRTTFNLRDIKKLEEQITVINYLVNNSYIVEEGETVKDFSYKITNKGRKWIFT